MQEINMMACWSDGAAEVQDATCWTYAALCCKSGVSLPDYQSKWVPVHVHRKT